MASSMSENHLDADVSRTGSLTHCVRGHEMNDENTRISKPCPTHNSQRFCRICQKENMRRYRAAKKVEAA